MEKSRLMDSTYIGLNLKCDSLNLEQFSFIITALFEESISSMHWNNKKPTPSVLALSIMMVLSLSVLALFSWPWHIYDLTHLPQINLPLDSVAFLFNGISKATVGFHFDMLEIIPANTWQSFLQVGFSTLQMPLFFSFRLDEIKFFIFYLFQC